MFKLHEVLEQDSHYLSDLELSQLRLIDNQNFPWIILVPRKDNIVEITDLTDTEYQIFSQEIKQVAWHMQNKFAPHKLNIGAIGNVVPQLHMHIIARYRNDKLFPKPVWGDEFLRYEPQQLTEIMQKLKL